MGTDAPGALLERVRKLLAKAEAEGVTPQEAEALTGKATELMARYGIDRALLAAAQPQTDRPANKIIDVYNPWSQVKAHLLSGLATAIRCTCVQLPTAVQGGTRIHVFGYASDLERAEILYTSLLIQMAHGLIAAAVPAGVRSVRAWRRSWMLGYVSAVVTRVREAEDRAAAVADREHTSGPSTALVLADRSGVVRGECARAYPHTRRMRVTYTGNGYTDGYTEGQRADVGTARIKASAGRALTR
ncbi:MAG TPA: DUF2786 domain-containing protein [Streptosporangiaceae bacterium]|nr:DUF2786 domain-containing protein [Streptosporangiaceae bacterium]